MRQCWSFWNNSLQNVNFVCLRKAWKSFDHFYVLGPKNSPLLSGDLTRTWSHMGQGQGPRVEFRPTAICKSRSCRCQNSTKNTTREGCSTAVLTAYTAKHCLHYFIGFTDSTVYTTWTPNLTLTAFTSGTAYTYTMLEQLNTLFYFDTMGFGSLCYNLVTTTRAFAVLINGLHKSRNPPIQDWSAWRTWEKCRNGQLGGNVFLLMMMIWKYTLCVCWRKPKISVFFLQAL